MADPGTYRPAVELKAYQAIDPLSIASRNLELRYPSAAELAEVGSDNIGRLTTHMLNAGHIEHAEIEAIRKSMQKVVDDAVEFALQSPDPTMDAAWQHLACNRHNEVLI